MSRKKRFIEKLTKTEKSSLEQGHRSGKSHIFRRKCQCILLSHSGHSVNELSKLYGITRYSIYKWFDSWEASGIEGLKLKPGRGRPKKLNIKSKKQVKQIKKLVENEPKNLTRVVGQIKSALGIDLSKKTLTRFLKNLNTNGNGSEDV